MPLARSRRSTSAVRSPREAASSATPAPVMPPPMTSTSSSSPAMRAMSAARCAALSDPAKLTAARSAGRSQASSISAQLRVEAGVTASSTRAGRGDHQAAHHQLEQPGHRVATQLADRPVPAPSGEIPAHGVDRDLLCTAASNGEVGEQPVTVELDDPAEARRPCAARAQQRWWRRSIRSRAVGSAVARSLGVGDDHADLAGQQAGPQGGRVGERAVHRHATGAGPAGHVGDSGPGDAALGHARARGVEQGGIRVTL